MPIPPTTKKISHPFGEKRWKRYHNGVDYDVVLGTPVKASANGIVVRSTMHEPSERIVLKKQVNNMGAKEKKFFGSYGNVIILYHGMNIKTLKHTYTLYAHLDHRSVRANEKVKEGQMIGTSAKCGTRQGFYNHKGGFELHFEVLQSKEELKWLKTAPLDFQFAEEHWRIDPECFFSRPFRSDLKLPVPYNKLPVGLDFRKNIKEARTMANVEFANAFTREGKWNMRHTYKNSGLIRDDLTNLGNYNYGLTGAAAGYPTKLLHFAGAMDQYFEGKQKEEDGLWPTDNPDDTFWINRGIEDYKTGMWKQGASGCI